MRKPWKGERSELGDRAHCSEPRLCVCRNICDEVRGVAPFILLSSIRQKDDARPVLIVGEITCCCDPDYSHGYMIAACHKVLWNFHKGFSNSSIDRIYYPLYFKLLTCGLWQKRVQIKPRLPLKRETTFDHIQLSYYLSNVFSDSQDRESFVWHEIELSKPHVTAQGLLQSFSIQYHLNPLNLDIRPVWLK